MGEIRSEYDVHVLQSEPPRRGVCERPPSHLYIEKPDRREKMVQMNLEVHEHGGHSTESQADHGGSGGGSGVSTGRTAGTRGASGGRGTRSVGGGGANNLSRTSEDMRTVGVAQRGARLRQLGAAGRSHSRCRGDSRSRGRSESGGGGGSRGGSRGRGAGASRGRSRCGGGGRGLRARGSSRSWGGSASRSARGRAGSGGACRDGDGLRAGAAAAINLPDNNVSSRALGNGDSAASSSTSTSNNIRAVHVVDTHLRGVDLAGKAVAAVTVTLNLDTESRLHVAEGSGGLEVDRVPTKLHVGISVADGVGTGGVRRPVTDWVGASTPDAAFLGGDTRGIDVVLGGCLAPVGHIGDGKRLELLDQSGNKHSLITRQDSLAERNGLSSLVFSLDGTGTILAVRLVRERLLDLAVLVTVQTAILDMTCQ